MKSLFGALATTALAALPVGAMAQAHYGAIGHPVAAYHAPMAHGMGYRPANRPMNVQRNVYGAMNNNRSDGMRRVYGAQQFDHNNRMVDHRFEGHDFARNQFARNDVRNRGRFRGAYDAGFATIAIGGYAPYAGDYGDDSDYADNGGYDTGSYDAGNNDAGYAQNDDSDQDGGYQTRAYSYRGDDQAQGYDRGDWSAGAPPADCGRWVWRDYANRYQWVQAACPCPTYDER